MVQAIGVCGVLLLLLIGPVALADGLRPAQRQEAFDRTIDRLRFDTPTRIEGRLLLPDTYDDAIWVELTRVFDDGQWLEVLHAVQLLVYARDPEMMQFFRKLPRDTVLRMTIRTDQGGKRRILELEGT